MKLRERARLPLQTLPPVDRRLAHPEESRDLLVSHVPDVEGRDHPLTQIHRVRPPPSPPPRRSRSKSQDRIKREAL